VKACKAIRAKKLGGNVGLFLLSADGFVGHRADGEMILILLLALYQSRARGGPVGEYRFSILDAHGTLNGSASRLHCSDDGVAIKHAEEMIGGNFVELWQGERRVGRFETVRSRKGLRSS
jgi:hypothetical protein